MSENRLLILTSAYSYPPTDYSFLEASCTAVGGVLHKVGEGATWPGFTGRLAGVVDYLTTNPNLPHLEGDVVLFLDSADTFILDRPATIVRKFLGMRTQFLFSAEKNCWPDASLANHFPGHASPWRFLNAGSWIGRRNYVVNYLTHVHATYASQWANDDTRCYVQDWIDSGGGRTGIDIDVHCEIFQSMYMHVDGEIDWVGKNGNLGLTNTITGTTPSCWHFNGRTPGRELAYERAVAAGRVERVEKVERI